MDALAGLPSVGEENAKITEHHPNFKSNMFFMTNAMYTVEYRTNERFIDLMSCYIVCQSNLVGVVLCFIAIRSWK